MKNMHRLTFLAIVLVTFSRVVLCVNFDTQEKEIKKICNVFAHAKAKNFYSGTKFVAGYQSHKIGDYFLVGQRDLGKRLAKVPYDFTNKTVLDIGTNQGGMLLELADKIACGIGIDYDAKLVNAANRLKSCVHANNIDFYVFDLDKEPLPHINNFLKSDRVDICFFLSMCCWVKNWKQVIEYACQTADALLFETNGSDELEKEEIAFIHQKYQRVILVSETSEDDKIQKKRKMFLCHKN